jgi:hypothetical protein
MSFFKMNVILLWKKIKNKIIVSYLLGFCDIWYGILEHMNYNSMQRLINFESLPTIGFF